MDIIILKGSAYDFSLIARCLIILGHVSSHSTPFVQPWKGRSGTGLARVRGGRSGPGQTRLNFISFRVSFRYCLTFYFIDRIPYQRTVSEASPSTPKGLFRFI